MVYGLFRLAPAPGSRIPGCSGLGEGTVSSLSSQSACSFKYRCLELSLCGLLTGRWNRVHSSFRRW